MGWAIITALSLSPVLIWATIRPLSDRFIAPVTTLTSIGQLLGLVGMTMFALTFVLSTRHPLLERLFNGMNRAYVAHHTFGAIAFSLLLFHPILLALKYAVASSPRDAASFLLSTDPNILWGTFALLSMMLFIILTFFVSFAYDKWKITHQFLAASFLLASIHALVIYSDTQVSKLLYWYIATYIAVGFLAILYRTLAPRLFVSYTEYIVDEVRHLDEKTVEIFMSPAYRPLTYKAGQFIFISFQNEAVGKEFHPFSIASSPDDKQLVIAVRALGDHKGKFKLLEKGMVAKLEGPFGTFSYDQTSGKDQIWIAGGIGITPFLGMAKGLRDPAYKVKLYYCTKERAEAVFLDELTQVAQRNANFSVVSFCSNEQGFFSADVMQAAGEDIFTKEIFICGPPAMMSSLRQQLLAKGADPAHIHTEEFAFR